MRIIAIALALSACVAAFGGNKEEYYHANRYGYLQISSNDPLEHGAKYAVDSLLLSRDRALKPRQRAMKLKLMYVDAFLTTVKNDTVKLTVGEEYFIANGIPVKYYRELVDRCMKTTEQNAEFYKEREFAKPNPSDSRKELRKLYSEYFKETAATGITFEDFYANKIKEYKTQIITNGEWYDGPLPEISENPEPKQHEIDRFFGKYESDMSPEDLAMKRKLEYVAVFCSKIVDNRTVLTADKEYCRKNGIPEEYLDQLADRINWSETSADYFNLTEFGRVPDRAKGHERDRKTYTAFLEENKKNGITYDEFLKNLTQEAR